MWSSSNEGRRRRKRELFIKCFVLYACMCLCLVCEEMLHKITRLSVSNRKIIINTAQETKNSLFLCFETFFIIFFFFKSQQLMGHAHILVLVFLYCRDEMPNMNSVLHIHTIFFVFIFH